jgi:cyclophilin family peptidyl-prolyl cis-trans isomerase
MAKRERQRQNRAARLEQEAALAKRRKFWRSVRGFVIILVPVLAIGIILAISGDDNADEATSSATSSTAPTTTTLDPAAPPFTIDTAKKYVATVDTSEGTFEIALDAKDAPQTVNSFVTLARRGYFDGLSFHRIAKDFVIQGGDPKGDGTGGPGYRLPDEPPSEGYRRYSVAMANSGPGTSGSQFFVVTTDDGVKKLGGPPYKYSDVGMVTSGFDTIDRLNALGSSASSPSDQKPTKPVTIRTITIVES